MWLLSKKIPSDDLFYLIRLTNRHYYSLHEQKKADDAVFTATSTMLYAEHINWHLLAHGVPNLHALPKDADSIKNLEKILLHPSFIEGVIRQDTILGDGHMYSTAL